MKKTLTIITALSLVSILNSCDDERIVPEEISLEQTMQTSHIGKLDDKLSTKEKKKLYKVLFANPEKFGFKKTSNDLRFDYFNRKGYAVYLRTLPYNNEENIVISKNSSQQKATPTNGYFVFSYNCICSGMASLADITNNTADDLCTDIDAGIVNLDELGSSNIEGYGIQGVPPKTNGQWVAIEAGYFFGNVPEYDIISQIAEDLVDGWISLDY
ncbi:hypothetical protein HNP38_000965 [Chryseobacterium defluvii]|uniref:Uncharacterized protein n=1 Tax=Chryseobacterium defluvii TaxID=160396 RepID=A0A840KDS1_9FLAO|nr:hypothetical protein [Chryseobacterium defluvii]MBB4805693.1 hypothetical protein [Chryseobacterium defluvii]